jgi:hypothetical protein
LLQNNLRFVWAVTRFPAANWLGAACVDSEFESKDSLADASFIKDVPVLLNHRFQFTASCEVDVGADVNVLLELRGVAIAIPEVYVGASRFEGGRQASH